MPTKREILNRPRRPRFTPQAIALFAELERVPMRRRDCQEFKDREHRLARFLGLTSEFWTGNSVLDRSESPCHPEGYIANDDWRTCRALRRALLQAAKAAG
jgi:hypothetical protein